MQVAVLVRPIDQLSPALLHPDPRILQLQPPHFPAYADPYTYCVRLAASVHQPMTTYELHHRIVLADCPQQTTSIHPLREHYFELVLPQAFLYHLFRNLLSTQHYYAVAVQNLPITHLN